MLRKYRLPFSARRPNKPSMVRGDDLQDDYVPDSDLVIVSGEEGRGSDEEEEDYEEFQGIGDLDLKLSIQDSDQSNSKKRKRREKEKEKRAKVCCLRMPTRGTVSS